MQTCEPLFTGRDKPFSGWVNIYSTYEDSGIGAPPWKFDRNYSPGMMFETKEKAVEVGVGRPVAYRIKVTMKKAA